MASPVEIWRNHKKIHRYLGQKGKVVVSTTIFTPPAGFEHEAPYIVAIVELENGERKTLQVVDSKEVSQGQEIMCVIRRIGKMGDDSVIEYGIKAKPV